MFQTRHLRRHRLGRVLAAAVTLQLVVGLVGASAAFAGGRVHHRLELDYVDPVGDNSGPIDITAMQMLWDRETGDYVITFTADAAHPFTGAFRVDLHLWDATAGSRLDVVCKYCDQFSPKHNTLDFDLGSARQTALEIQGKTKVVMGWSAGDQVSVNSWSDLGNPPGVGLFRTTVTGWPIGFLTNEDVLGVSDPDYSTCSAGVTCPSSPDAMATVVVLA